MRRTFSPAVLIVIPLVVGACSSRRTAAPATAAMLADTDALLALAPAGTRRAVVASSRAVGLAEAGLGRVRATLGADAATAPYLAKLDALVGGVLGAEATRGLAASGLTAASGFARFELADDAIITIWPVGDRGRFVAARGGRATGDGVDEVTIAGVAERCRAIMGAYACSADAAVLARLGTGSLAARPTSAWPRGDVEVIAGRDGGPASGAASIVAVGLEPGQAVIRARVDGPVDDYGEMRSAVALDGTRASGFLGVAVPPPLLAKAAVAAGDNPMATKVLRALQGQLTAIVPSGADDVDLRMPFVDVTAAREVLTLCPMVKAIGVATSALVDGACVIEIVVPDLMSLGFSVWLDGNDLRLAGTRGPTPPVTGPPPAGAGLELARGPWSVVLWGRGNPLDRGGSAASMAGMVELMGSAVDAGGAALVLRAMASVAELGAGFRVDGDDIVVTAVVRTLFANPAPIVEALPALISRVAEGEDVSEEVAALAAAHPSSPLAADVAAGAVGLRVPTAVLTTFASMANRIGASVRDDE